MKIFKLPYTDMHGIELSADNKYLLQMKAHEKHLNHIKTIHASALYSLAEISSGHYLNICFPQFSENTVPLIRNAQISYKGLANGHLYSTAKFIGHTITEIEDILLKKKKVTLQIEVKVMNADHKTVSKAVFDWFVTLK